jgi:hypothetical protein
MDIDRIHRVIKNIANNQFVTDGPCESWPQLPQVYLDRMKDLGEKYRNIRWLPLDIPKIEIPDIEEFKEIWKEQCHPILRVKPDAAEPWNKDEHPLGDLSSWNVPQFNGLHLYSTNEIDIEFNTFVAKMYKGKVPLFERIVEQCFDYFPIQMMTDIFIWQSTMEILPHRDKGSYWKCPDSFRVMLHDENTKPTLYVADIEHKDVHYIDLPKDTNSFCWSNGTQVHGSDYHGKTKYLLVVAGVQHSKLTDRLLERSIEKYKDVLNYELKL